MSDASSESAAGEGDLVSIFDACTPRQDVLIGELAEDQFAGSLADVTHSEERWLHFCNREETDTRLKNGNGGERFASIRPQTAEILDDYIDRNHHEVEDDHGRESLFSSQYGRLSKQGMRQAMPLV